MEAQKRSPEDARVNMSHRLLNPLSRAIVPGKLTPRLADQTSGGGKSQKVGHPATPLPTRQPDPPSPCAVPTAGAASIEDRSNDGDAVRMGGQTSQPQVA